MNRSDLVEVIAKDKNIARRQAERAVNAVFGAIADAMHAGDRVEIRGFGSFTTRDREAYVGRNPRTGTQVQVPSKRLPFFRVGKDLKDRINGDD